MDAVIEQDEDAPEVILRNLAAWADNHAVVLRKMTGVGLDRDLLDGMDFLGFVLRNVADDVEAGRGRRGPAKLIAFPGGKA